MDRKYEYNKARQYLRHLAILIPAVQMCSLIFFTLVGKFEKTDTGMILQSDMGVITLSSTVTLSIITIYVVYMLNKNLTLRYIGNFRERTYMYPCGRNQMFTSKLNSALYVYAVLFIVTLSIVNILYIFFSRKILGFGHDLFYFADLLVVLNIVIMSLIISLTDILSSLIFGIKFQSTNISLITSVIFMAVIGNAVANSYILPNFMMIFINICIFLIDYAEIKYLSYMIINDDVME